MFLKEKFGDSCILRLNINHLLSDKVWISLGISLAALFFSYLVAIPIGIYSAVSRNPIANNSVRLISYLGLALPSFLFALVIMLMTTIFLGNRWQAFFPKNIEMPPGPLPNLWIFGDKGLASNTDTWMGSNGICTADGQGTDVG